MRVSPHAARPFLAASERNVVIDVGVVPAGLARGGSAGRCCASRLRRRLGGLVPVFRVAAAAITPAQHLHVPRHDLRGVAILTVLSLPLARLDIAFDIDLPAFAQVLLGDFSELPEHHHSVPFRPLAPLVGLPVRPGIAGCEAKIRDGAAARAIAGLRVRPEIADENDLVDTPCHALLLRIKKWPTRSRAPALGARGR